MAAAAPSKVAPEPQACSVRLSLNPSRIARSFESVFPAVQYFEMEARYPKSWLHGSGTLQSLMSICFSDMKAQQRAGRGSNGQCAALEGQLDMRETQLLLTNTFGVAREKQIAAVDEESARAFVASQSALQRSSITSAQAHVLAEACEDGGEAAECQAAANAAAVAQLDEAAQMNGQMALANRLQTIRIEQENAKMRREEADSTYRENQIQHGVEQLAAPPPRMKADGFLLDDAQVQP